MISHSFAICAYKENPFLEEAIISVLNQTSKSKAFLVTSTPNEMIQQLAHKYKLPLYVNPESKGIASDWNFAYACADTEYVTLTHQDDLYAPNYVCSILNAVEKHPDTIFAFTDYYELRRGAKVDQTRNLKIKRLMNSAISVLPKSVKWREFVLAFGCSICCPSVTYHKSKIGGFTFDRNFRDCLDWEAYLRLGKMDGRVLYLPGKLICHRIYEESTTTEAINDGCRSREEQQIFNSIWPKPIASLLCKLYSSAQQSNDLK